MDYSIPIYDKEKGKFNYFRQSLLKSFMRCPKMIELEYEMGFIPEKRKPALVRGTAVHKSIERFHKDRVGKGDAIDLYKECFKETLEDPNEEHKTWEVDDGGSLEEEIEKSRSDGEEIFFHYAVQKHNLEANVIASECGFVFHTQDGHEIRGTIDQVRDTTDGLLLMDTKTDQAEPSPFYLANDVQFKTYYYSTYHGKLFLDGQELTLPGRISKIAWYQMRNNIPYKRRSSKGGVVKEAGELRGDPFKFIEKDETHLQLINNELQTIIRAIEAKVYYKNAQSMGTCNMCSFVNACLGVGQMTRDDLTKLRESKAQQLVNEINS